MSADTIETMARGILERDLAEVSAAYDLARASGHEDRRLRRDRDALIGLLAMLDLAEVE